MKLTCAPLGHDFSSSSSDLDIVLYGYADLQHRGEAGASIVKEVISRSKLQPDARAWDLMSIALAVIAADVGVLRRESSDGWTRELDLHVAVSDPDFWTSQKELIEQQLRFLTTDIWQCSFDGGGFLPTPPKSPTLPLEDCVALLSGGQDSLVGVVDLVSRETRKPFVVSQVSQGDKQKQAQFAAAIGGGLRHLQLNHNANCPGQNERSQRARSLIFLAYSVLAEGQVVKLFVCENGFISINPPLTSGRLGSLSTRTTHPVFLVQFQNLLDAAGLRVKVINPYQLHTKGEMLMGCADQTFLRENAHIATSCGRYARNGYKHCGRCVPCMVRRAAFEAWGQTDRTTYVYRNLSLNTGDYARFDDVRSTAMAVAQVQSEGLDSLLGTSLSSALLGDVTPYRETVERGLDEIGSFLNTIGVLT